MPNFHQKHKTHYVLLIFFGIITLASGLIRFNLLAPDKSTSGNNVLLEDRVENQKDSEKLTQNKQEIEGEAGTEIKTNFETLGETNKNKQKNEDSNAASSSTESNRTDKAKTPEENKNLVLTTNDSNSTATQDKGSSAVETKPFTLKVNGNVYEAELSPDISLYEGMKEIAKQNPNFTFTGKDFGPGLGFFVESINGLANSAKEKRYWIYYINGAKAQIGVSAYHLKSGDIIEWNYEKEE